MTTESKLKGSNCEDFVEEFIKEYIKLGFGILSKRDLEVLLFLYSEDEAIERMVKVIEDQRFEVETINGRTKYIYQIREPLLRQYFGEWVDRVKGIADTSFSPTIVIISREVFLPGYAFYWDLPSNM